MNGVTAASALGDLCKFLNGGTPAKSIGRYFEGDIPWITGADIEGPVAYDARSFITQEAVETSATNQVPPGTILLVTRTSVGKVAIAGRSLCFSQDITALSPNSSKLDASYLAHFLRTQKTRFARETRGATIQGITRDVVANTRIPLPSISEQRRIAAILDQAETLRAQRRAVIAQLDSLVSAVFFEMFEGADEKDWQIATVRDVAQARDGSMRTGPFGSQLLHSEFVDQGVAVLGIDNAVANEFRWAERRFITESKYRQLKRYTVNPGDVLITIMGTCGRCAVVPADIPRAINTKHLCCITLDPAKCLPEFLHAYFLRHPLARKYLAQTAKGAIMSGLNLGVIKAMPIPLVPLGLQRHFVDRVRAIEQLKSAHSAALANLDELFTSLQHRAFRGELAASARVTTAENLRSLEAAVGLEALIFVAKRMPAGRHHHYKSLKALYFADKRHLEKHGRLIYGETHSALPHGPVPQAAYDATRVLNGERLISDFDDEALRAGLRRIKDDQQDKLVPLRDADFSKLGHAERESLEWAIRYCADMSFEQVKAASHDTAYERTPANAPIPVEYMTDMLPPGA